MKKLLFIIIIHFCLVKTYPQTKLFDNNSSTDVVRLDPQSSQYNFVPGEILLKLKDNLDVSLHKDKNLNSLLGINTIDIILQKYKSEKVEKLYPYAKPLINKGSVKIYNGKLLDIPILNNIFKIRISNEKQTLDAIEELNRNTSIEYAEPNYIYSITNDKPVSSILSEKDIKILSGNNYGSQSWEKDQNIITPNDPFYSLEWWIQAIKADAVWNKTTGNSTQIIAILDTGVDWQHPDLTNNIWLNSKEIPNNGIDDDNDGFIDDIRGWDFINNDNNPTDDNSHGTHVAGIAAAEGNNGIGITGVSWNSKIMPIKVFQSSGRGDVATITQGILYAIMHGASIINMSFGSYARSFTMEATLGNAYATAFLVAAAGNDGLFLENCYPAAPFFPAALSYVLGVQSPESIFSNLDCNGPTYSNTTDLLNYEMKAPGTNILSTIPNGAYRIYQGTSMATPIISGALSLYRILFPLNSETPEITWTKLIQATDQYLNLDSALTITPKPEIRFINQTTVDTLGSDDRDGIIDVGETIELWFAARNTGGRVDSVFWQIKLADFEDTSTCNILKAISAVGSIGPYSVRTSQNDPMLISISPELANDRDISFIISAWYKGSTDTVNQAFVLTVENGEQLSGVLADTKILYPNRLYLINQSFKIGVDGTLIISPGTKIIFYPGRTVPVSGLIIAEGKPDSLIIFSGYLPPDSNYFVSTLFEFRNNQYNIHNRFNYCKFENVDNKVFSGDANVSVLNSVFYAPSIGNVDSLINSKFYYTNMGPYRSIDVSNVQTIAYKNNIFGSETTRDFYFNTDLFIYLSGNQLIYNNFINCAIPRGQWDNSETQNAWISEYSKPYIPFSSDSMYYKNLRKTLTKYSTDIYSQADFENVLYQYWGTIDTAKIEGFINDFIEFPTVPRAIYKPFLLSPPEANHGVVWKILLNDKDIQDEQVDPVGIGKQKIDVFFNRQMDKSVTPTVSFGPRYPFNSNLADEDGNWSDDGKIWTVYKTIKLNTGDGINRIRVEGAKDLEDWEIPKEDMRFDFLIDAATSASLEFTATVRIKEVYLEWHKPDIPDLLGFNVYRFSDLNDSTFSDTIRINNELVIDTVYTDVNVIPQKKYYYYYKILTTDLAESSQSKVVSATPLTEINDNREQLLPNEYALSQNYPNPFNPSTTIRYGLPTGSKVSIKIYNLLGQVIRELVNNTEPAGYNEITFNASNLASGIYFYRITAISLDGKRNFVDTKKLILMK